MIFRPSPLRRFIEQGLIHAPTFWRCAKRAAGGTDAGKLARALPGQGGAGRISSERDSADAATNTRRSYIR
jgi:hypothetical protein